MKTPESQSDCIKQLQKENEDLLGDLQSCQAGHEALVKERDQLKLHVQCCGEALDILNADFADAVTFCDEDEFWKPKFTKWLKKTFEAASTTPSLNDYVPRSVVDEMHSAIDELWDFMDVYHESHCLINDSTEPRCDCGYGQKYERLKNIVSKALTAYQSTQKEQSK